MIVHIDSTDHSNNLKGQPVVSSFQSAKGTDRNGYVRLRAGQLIDSYLPLGKQPFVLPPRQMSRERFADGIC
jgi:hypothetical protein